MNRFVVLARLFLSASAMGVAILPLSLSVSAHSGVVVETSKQAVHTRTPGITVAVDLPQRSRPSITQGGATRSAAESDLKYMPSANLPRRSRPSVTGGAATRGTDPTVELLAPQDHTGVTSATHPTFYWYMSAVPSSPVEFALRDEQADQTLLVSRVAIQASGVVKFELPKDMPALAPNTDYSWSVTLTHDPKDVEDNTVYKAMVRWQSMTPQQAEALGDASSNRDRAIVYAQAGLWYDAIAQLTAAYLANPKDLNSQDDVLSLLSQVNLDQAVELAPSPDATTRSAISVPTKPSAPVQPR